MALTGLYVTEFSRDVSQEALLYAVEVNTHHRSTTFHARKLTGMCYEMCVCFGFKACKCTEIDFEDINLRILLLFVKLKSTVL